MVIYVQEYEGGTGLTTTNPQCSDVLCSWEGATPVAIADPLQGDAIGSKRTGLSDS
ncbi:MAG: hypothetical protein VKK80_00505 [Prochlorothrix sp.]|nr:hypothetical protein [Prochlorothrix sp.]